MAYNYSILLGRIIKVSGYGGAVAVKLEKIFIENIHPVESVFLEIEGRPVPFFINESDYSGADILKLSFEGYDSIEKIREFVGCRIFLTSEPEETDSEAADTQLLIGYRIVTQDDELIGKVTDIISNNSQWLLNVSSSQGKDLLIPFHEDFIIRIDKRDKVVIMDIPEGLLEIN